MDSSTNSVSNVLRGSGSGRANQRSQVESPAEVFANKMRDMNSHDLIAMLEMFAQNGDNGMAFDVFQTLKNLPDVDEEQEHAVALVEKKEKCKKDKKHLFPSFRRTQQADAWLAGLFAWQTVSSFEHGANDL